MRRLFKMPPQITRLVLLTIGIVAVYSIARYFLTPPSFGQYGWYRGNALEEMAAPLPVFAGKRACQECHAEEVATLSRFEHGNLTCEVCHGIARAHAGNPDTHVVKPSDSQCLRCHEAEPARPRQFKQVQSRTHYRGQRCIECHVPHHPSEVP
jgi:hypothetical protein